MLTRFERFYSFFAFIGLKPRQIRFWLRKINNFQIKKADFSALIVYSFSISSTDKPVLSTINLIETSAIFKTLDVLSSVSEFVLKFYPDFDSKIECRSDTV